MRLLIIVVPDDYLNDVLLVLTEAGIFSGTLIESSQIEKEVYTRIPIFAGFHRLTEERERQSHTIFALASTEQIKEFREAISLLEKDEGREILHMVFSVEAESG